MHGDFTLFLRKCGGKDVAYAANRLASLTGMRAGEILDKKSALTKRR